MKLDRLSNKAQRQQLISAARPQYLLHLPLEIMQTIVYSSSAAGSNCVRLLATGNMSNGKQGPWH
jgi:hypothetical protein